MICEFDPQTKGYAGVDAGWLIGGGCLAALAALVLYRGGQVQAQSIERSAAPDKVHDLRVGLRWMTRIAWPCGGAAAALAIWPAHWSAIGPGPAAVVVLVALVCLVLPIAAARRPVISAYARLRGIPVRSLRPYRRMAATAILMVVFLGPIAAVLATSAGVAVQVVILLVGYLVVVPLLAGLLIPALARILGPGPLPAEVQARLSDLAATLGVRVHGRLTPARERKVANGWQGGWLPGLSYLTVTDYLLDELTPAEVGASLAHELAHARHRDSLTRLLLISPIGVALGLLLTGIARDESATLLTVLSAVIIVGTIGLGRLTGVLAIRQELAADDLAVTAVGPDALAAALTRLTELNAIKRDTSLTWDRRVGHPGVAMRIARLQAADHVPVGDPAPAGPEK
jgi:STE24 endopeptidase